MLLCNCQPCFQLALVVSAVGACGEEDEVVGDVKGIRLSKTGYKMLLSYL